jgi:hypothetical protein
MAPDPSLHPQLSMPSEEELGRLVERRDPGVRKVYLEAIKRLLEAAAR